MMFHPTNNKGVVTSGYGYRSSGWHGALDIGVPTGTLVYAVEDGIIDQIGQGCSEGYWNCGGGFGNYVSIDHHNDFYTNYAHLSEVRVKKGEFVNRGDVIGVSGNTGSSTGAHLHFEVRQGGWLAPTTFDPLPYIKGEKNLPKNLSTIRWYKRNWLKYTAIGLGVGAVAFSAYKVFK
jgi:murein DD-endopeptidase MepM/ murein hydrolase activator NlpD